MFAKNLGVLAVALVAEVCAAGGPNFLTLCIHEDGTVRYEPTLALCCKQNQQGQGECCSHEGADPAEQNGIDQDDACQDYGVTISQVVLPRQSIKQFLLDGAALTEWLPLVALVPVLPFSRQHAAIDGCGPPRDHILSDLSNVVLRI